MVSKQNLQAIILSIGLILTLFGVFMAWYGFPNIINSKIKEGLSLEKDTESYKLWEVTPFPLKFKVYFFNVENPDDVQNGANPIVKELGPYVYDEYRRKEKVSVNETADTLTYILKKTYFFNEKESGCRSDEDYITVLNAALVGTALTVQSMFPSALGTISDAVPYLFPGIKNIFTTVKVKDLLFNGLLIDCSSETIDFVCNAMRSTAPETVRMHENKRDFLFSMFHHLNDTEEGPYTIGRGMKNTSRGRILSFENEDILDDVWKSRECNMINGTDTTIYAPMKEPHSRLYIFSSDLCRSLYIEFIKKKTTFGIPTYRYENTDKVLDSVEENDCFCPRGKDANFNTIMQCTPKGTLNLMPCMKAPTIYSNPHFYLGDRQLLNYITGLKPNKALHESFVELEPLTGTPVNGLKRAQFNLEVRPLEDFEILANVTAGVMPMLWIEEGALLPPHLRNKLLDAYSQIHTVNIIKWLIISIGLLFLLMAAIFYIRKDKIWCANDSKVEHFTEPARIRPDDKPVISNVENNFNTTLNYPSLYPQLVNRNINIGPRKFPDDRFLL